MKWVISTTILPEEKPISTTGRGKMKFIVVKFSLSIKILSGLASSRNEQNYERELSREGIFNF